MPPPPPRHSQGRELSPQRGFEAQPGAYSSARAVFGNSDRDEVGISVSVRGDQAKPAAIEARGYYRETHPGWFRFESKGGSSCCPLARRQFNFQC
jgi:hypothetical protein